MDQTRGDAVPPSMQTVHTRNLFRDGINCLLVAQQQVGVDGRMRTAAVKIVQILERLVSLLMKIYLIALKKPLSSSINSFVYYFSILKTFKYCYYFAFDYTYRYTQLYQLHLSRNPMNLCYLSLFFHAMISISTSFFKFHISSSIPI